MKRFKEFLILAIDDITDMPSREKLYKHKKVGKNVSKRYYC